MRKLLRIILSCLTCVGILSSVLGVYASSELQYESNERYKLEQAKQDEIDVIFEDLTELATEKRKLNYSLESGMILEEKYQDSMNKINSQKFINDKKLLELGVIKIDPTNNTQMNNFTNMVLSAYEKKQI